MSEFQKDELSLEETNKLRISLGLKPLVADDATATAEKASAILDPDLQASRNYQEKAEKERQKREDADLKQRLARAQAKREAARRLNGPTLAEPEPSASTAAANASSSNSDTLQWLKESKKRAKQHAARRAQEIQDQELAREQLHYDERDLAGLRVAHGLDEFGEGEERILTLKDSGVLDDADDQLLDSTLDQKEQDKLNADRKKGLKQYSGLDEDETETGRNRGVLSKYDADLPPDGTTQSTEGGFRLGSDTPSSIDVKPRLRKEAEEEAKLSNKQLLSLDYTKNQEISDYLQEGDVGFKKPKTKKRRKAAKVKLELDDEDEPTQSPNPTTIQSNHPQDIEMKDDAPIVPRHSRREAVENFVDDDDLQTSLAQARRHRAKKTFSKTTPEMIARNLAAQREAEALERSTDSSYHAPRTDVGADSGSFTFDETSEFVRAIRERPLETESRSIRSTQRTSAKQESSSPVPIKREDPVEVEDVPMQELSNLPVKEEQTDNVEDNEVAEPDTVSALVGSPDTDTIKDSIQAGDAVTTSTLEEAEPMVGRGLAGTLTFLRNQGMLPQTNPELKEREQSQQQYDAWLAARRREEAVREASRQASKASGASIDQATREAQNRNRELDEARRAQDRFKDYKPDVEIKYHDEFGRDLDQKEAWKHLSHVFHGKMPGTKKVEKRLKKIEDERKRAQMAAGDTPTGMMGAFQTRSERTGQAHMVLSVGNKGSAPQQNDLLSVTKPMQLKKSTAVDQVKANGGTHGQASQTRNANSPSPAPNGNNGIDSQPEASTSTATTKTGGWTRISSTTPAAAAAAANSTTTTSSTQPVAETGTADTASGSTPNPPPPTGVTPFKMSFGVKRKTMPDK